MQLGFTGVVLNAGRNWVYSSGQVRVGSDSEPSTVEDMYRFRALVFILFSRQFSESPKYSFFYKLSLQNSLQDFTTKLVCKLPLESFVYELSLHSFFYKLPLQSFLLDPSADQKILHMNRPCTKYLAAPSSNS
ncbi:hypothetical protein MRB53_024526 [Persea americana]|uniref:Uncharacterized protein n=1 Tax=Persea americana TaxID=3435 RepID=A0ACC2LDF0_PERAE|nr:hypothetical protein MRB53_024526 [Persea americana]